MADRIKGITIKIEGDTTGLSKALSGVNKQISTTQKELRDVERLLKLDPKNTELLAQKQRALANEITAVREKLAGLKDAEKQVQEQFQQGKISQEQYDALRREIIATENQLEKLEAEAKKLDPSALERASEVTKEWGAALETVSGKAEAVAQKTRAISAAAAAALGGAAFLASNYEDALAKVSTIADESVVSMDDMAEAISDLSNRTGIASADLADAVYNAISAGQDTADAVSFVERATMLARAGFTDTASALDVLTTIMNAYKLEAGEVTNVSDLLIATQNYGKTTVAELSQAVGKVIPTAAAYGVQLDQLAASYAIVTANGVNTRNATTYLNSLLNELGKSGSTVSDILVEKTGKSFAQLSEEGVTLGEALEIIKDAATEQGLAFNDMFSSSEAAKAGLILLGDSAAEFNTMLGKVRGSTGATETAFGKLDTTSYRVQKTINQAKNTVIELGRTVLELAAPALDNLSEIVENVRAAVGDMDDTTKKQIVTAIAAVAAISPLAGAIAKVTQAAAGLSNVVSLALAHPVVALILATTAAVAGLAIAANTAAEAEENRMRASAAAAVALDEQRQAAVSAALEMAEALQTAREATDQATESMGFQRDRAQDLVTELERLAGADGVVADRDQAHAQIIIDELNEAFGLEIEMIDGQIQSYDELTASVRDAIDAKTAEALLDRRRDDYLDALETEARLEGELSQARTDAANAAATLDQANRDLGAATQAQAEAQAAYNAAMDEAVSNPNLDEYGRAMAALTVSNNSEAASALEAANAELERAQIAADAAAAEVQTRTAAVDELNDAYRNSNRLITQYEAAAVAAQEGNTDRVINLMTGREQAWIDYGDRVDAETEAALNSMYQEVLEAAEYAAQVRENWKAGTEGYTEDMVQEAQDAFEDMRDAFADAYDEANGIGGDFMDGLDAGIQARRQSLLNTVNGIARDIPDRMRGVLQIQSPSKVAARIGGYFGAGLVIGLDRSTASVERAADAQAEAVVDAFRGMGAPETGAEIAAQTAGFFSMPAAVPAAGGNTTTNNSNTYGAVNITVNGAPGQDVRELADIVMEEIQQAVDRREAVYA